jgi:hypothetical protein
VGVGEGGLGSGWLFLLEVEEAWGGGGLLVSAVLPHKIAIILSDNKIICRIGSPIIEGCLRGGVVENRGKIDMCNSRPIIAPSLKLKDHS